MSKKKTGEFEMTPHERKLYLETLVSCNLANHYEKMATAYNERASRDSTAFWDAIKGRDNLPKRPYSITVLPDYRKIKIEIITDKEREIRFFKTIPSTKEFEEE